MYIREEGEEILKKIIIGNAHSRIFQQSFKPLWLEREWILETFVSNFWTRSWCASSVWNRNDRLDQISLANSICLIIDTSDGTRIFFTIYLNSNGVELTSMPRPMKDSIETELFRENLLDFFEDRIRKYQDWIVIGFQS